MSVVRGLETCEWFKVEWFRKAVLEAVKALTRYIFKLLEMGMKSVDPTKAEKLETISDPNPPQSNSWITVNMRNLFQQVIAISLSFFISRFPDGFKKYSVS